MTGADVLLVADDGAEFRLTTVMLMLHEIPSARMLTATQNGGLECVWCGTSSALVPLGGRFGWAPHACGPCRTARVTSMWTYNAWQTHRETCSSCVRTRCRAARPLALAHYAARRAAGKDLAVVCHPCKCQRDVIDSAVYPLVLDDTSWRFAHTGSCGIAPPGGLRTVHGRRDGRAGDRPAAGARRAL
ncbi:hypothetical protein ABTX35_01335 [Streptomyces sp. NPDC096080]|uniref:hypothetical protein n=1 Tax=Streptomyces sp. NPDC096080 TaxID=3156693 RepID=UPI003326478E